MSFLSTGNKLMKIMICNAAAAVVVSSASVAIPAVISSRQTQASPAYVLEEQHEISASEEETVPQPSVMYSDAEPAETSPAVSETPEQKEAPETTEASEEPEKPETSEAPQPEAAEVTLQAVPTAAASENSTAVLPKTSAKPTAPTVSTSPAEPGFDETETPEAPENTEAPEQTEALVPSPISGTIEEPASILREISGPDYKVTVIYTSDSGLTEDTEIRVTEKTGQSTDGTRQFEVTFYDADGNQLQPSGDVQISVSYETPTPSPEPTPEPDTEPSSEPTPEPGADPATEPGSGSTEEPAPDDDWYRHHWEYTGCYDPPETARQSEHAELSDEIT